MQATKSAKAPRKQRKLLHNAPAHLRHKLMAAPLSPELASKGVKTFPVRKGDSIRIMRGDHKGFEGKISRVDLKNYRIYVEGLTREKVDGTTIFVPVHPSKVTIRKLNLDDKWRKAIVERKKELPKKEEKAKKAVEKPPKKVAEVKEEKAAVVEKPTEKKPKARKKRVQKKPATKKKKEKKPTEEKPAKKEEEPKATKRTRAKRKTASEKEGGT